MEYYKYLIMNNRVVLPYLAAFLLLWFLTGCAQSTSYRPYVPVGSSLNGGTVQFYQWASR